MNIFNTHFVYKIIDSKRKLIYIGETNNLPVRISSHEHIEPGVTIEFFEVASKSIGKRVEKVLIFLFKPTKNKLISKSNPLFPKGFDFSMIKWRPLNDFTLS